MAHAHAEAEPAAEAAECAGQISRAALLDEDNPDQEETHDQVNDDEYVEENLLHF